MITLNYIKMCEKAKEIQTEWIPRSGDTFVYSSDHNFSENFGLYLGNIKYSFRGKDKHFIRDIRGIRKPSTTFNKSEYIWLSTQEQLQGMIDWEQKTSCYFGKNNNFYEWCKKPSIEGFNTQWLKFESMTELWLAFVMKEKFSKHWNGEDWIKIL